MKEKPEQSINMTLPEYLENQIQARVAEINKQTGALEALLRMKESLVNGEEVKTEEAGNQAGERNGKGLRVNKTGSNGYANSQFANRETGTGGTEA